jgi:CubicO group peptidase (beta-lactamase class C family)
MKFLKKKLVLFGLATLVWTLCVSLWTLVEIYRPPVARAGDSAAFARYATDKMDKRTVGNFAFVMVCANVICSEHYVSSGKPVTGETPFQVASLSKWVAAWGVMTLVQAGKVDLDAPISTYAKRWTLPESRFDANKVTVRRLLAHTAGLNDGLGYDGFFKKSDVQSLPASLTHAGDTTIGRSGKVRIGIAPGKGFEYSGGGFTLLQLMIEDVTGETFDAYMRRAVLVPLGMTTSAYLPTPMEEQRVAQSFESSGKLAPPRYYTATAAASLYTTTHDLVKFLNANNLVANAGVAPTGPLHPETVALMRFPHASKFGAQMWGLGNMIYHFDNGKQRAEIVGHDGGNMPAISTTARLNPNTGDGIIILSSGQTSLALRIRNEWTKWQIGKTSQISMLIVLQSAVTLWGVGLAVLLFAGIGVAIFSRLRLRPV